MRLALILPLLLFALTSPVAEGSGLVAIYPYYGTPLPDGRDQPIVLQVPGAFRYGSSKGQTRSYGINIMVFYPTFLSPKDPRNAPYIKGCKKDCGENILIYIGNQIRVIHNPKAESGRDYASMADVMVPAFRRFIHPRDSIVTKFGPEHGFDGGFQVDWPPSNLGSRVRRYFFHRGAEQGHYDLAVECRINSSRKSCSLHFSLICDPALYIWVVGLEMNRIDKFFSVQRRVNRFVSSMMRRPVCA